MLKIMKIWENGSQDLNGWETPPQPYTHWKEDIKGFQTRSIGADTAWACDSFGVIFCLKSSDFPITHQRFLREWLLKISYPVVFYVVKHQ